MKKEVAKTSYLFPVVRRNSDVVSEKRYFEGVNDALHVASLRGGLKVAQEDLVTKSRVKLVIDIRRH